MQQYVRYGLAAAVAAALGCGTANAEVIPYGKLHLSVGTTTSDDGTDKFSSTQVASHASRLGFKASKTLSESLTVLGQVEYEIDPTADKGESSTKDFFKARNTFVGFKGGFGELRVGIHDTPQKLATAKLDPFTDAYADYNNVLVTDSRPKNTVLYLNKVGAFELGASYSAGDDTPEADAENAKAITSAMVNYSAGPVLISLSTENHADRADGETESMPKAGLGITVGNALIGVVYEQYQKKGGGDNESSSYASLQWKVTDNGTFEAAYGKYDKANNTDDPTMTAVGYEQSLDKDLSLYALYASGDKDGLKNKAKLAGKGTALVIGTEFKF